MHSKCRTPLISTVHFKRQLSSSPTLPRETTQLRALKLKPNPSLSLSTLRNTVSALHPGSTGFYPHALKISAKLGLLKEGKQLHSRMIKLGFNNVLPLQTQMLNLYVKCKQFSDAEKLFDQMRVRNLVTWNTMIYVPVASALVDMYITNGNLYDAQKAFDGMTARNVVSWNTLIVGYAQRGDMEKVMELLREMRLQNFCPDELTMASIFQSCGVSSGSAELLQVHTYVIKNGFESFLSVTNALIHAYSKCGNIDGALQYFVSVSEPDLVTWTSIIGAYSFLGHSKRSVIAFEKMLVAGVKPDQIAFLAILSACSHGGLVNEGLHYFNIMMNDYQIIPDSKHYTCLVDLLGRAGLLNEAFSFITSHPVACTPDTLGAFIGACSIHSNITLAKWAAEKLVVLEPNKPVNYTLISNIYASKGRWLDVERVRKMMTDCCDYKIPGCSWV
ncbi:hypothetical protein V6Z11_D11G102700, partial [Gossypium hirsutum]|uniref:Pentatricopeptide repeat-containing protein At2g46050, mitochondrial-like n=1 Tax=Gossypium hirsutum TaxID=3635 RepID=A0ABM3B443_GOSHI|nr:pentatricopeptide repeat-containing protein At2g46050, mitochondrial-like [Gossypium hirsutum]